ncbi:MAG: sugar phosphate nucleotidyltransferase [Candidatus Nanoarchaeia archaeon]|nr:sugar phosphate nucleotidyltransferase [Candidatus Nanoarchaeia archaeon]
MSYNIDAIVLAAGSGSRLEPLTLREKGSIRTKGLVSICGQRPMSVIFGALYKMGLDQSDQIVIVAKEGYNRNRIMSEYEQRRTLEGIPLRMSWPTDDTENVGSADATLENMEQFEIKKDVLVCPNDCFVNGMSLVDIIKENKEKGAIATMAVYEVSAEEAAEKYGVLITDQDGTITKFMEKPTLEKMKSEFNIPDIAEAKEKKVFVNTGFYYLSNDILKLKDDEEIKEMRDSKKEGELDFGKHFFPWLVKNGYKVNTSKVRDFYDMGNIKSYMSTSLEIIKGNVEWIDYLKYLNKDFNDTLSFDVEKNIYISKSTLDMKIKINGKSFPTLRESIEKGYVSINKNVLISDDVRILPGTSLENCFIGVLATIGENCSIKGTNSFASTIYKASIIGMDTEIVDSIICTSAKVNPQNLTSKDSSKNKKTNIITSVVGDASLVNEGARIVNSKLYPNSFADVGIEIKDNNKYRNTK